MGFEQVINGIVFDGIDGAVFYTPWVKITLKSTSLKYDSRFKPGTGRAFVYPEK